MVLVSAPMADQVEEAAEPDPTEPFRLAADVLNIKCETFLKSDVEDFIRVFEHANPLSLEMPTLGSASEIEEFLMYRETVQTLGLAVSGCMYYTDMMQELLAKGFLVGSGVEAQLSSQEQTSSNPSSSSSSSSSSSPPPPVAHSRDEFRSCLPDSAFSSNPFFVKVVDLSAVAPPAENETHMFERFEGGGLRAEFDARVETIEEAREMWTVRMVTRDDGRELIAYSDFYVLLSGTASAGFRFGVANDASLLQALITTWNTMSMYREREDRRLHATRFNDQMHVRVPSPNSYKPYFEMWQSFDRMKARFDAFQLRLLLFTKQLLCYLLVCVHDHVSGIRTPSGSNMYGKFERSSHPTDATLILSHPRRDFNPQGFDAVHMDLKELKTLQEKTLLNRSLTRSEFEWLKRKEFRFLRVCQAMSASAAHIESSWRIATRTATGPRAVPELSTPIELFGNHFQEASSLLLKGFTDYLTAKGVFEETFRTNVTLLTFQQGDEHLYRVMRHFLFGSDEAAARAAERERVRAAEEEAHTRLRQAEVDERQRAADANPSTVRMREEARENQKKRTAEYLTRRREAQARIDMQREEEEDEHRVWRSRQRARQEADPQEGASYSGAAAQAARTQHTEASTNGKDEVQPATQAVARLFRRLRM